ncbi:MAG: lipoprotein-releasing ABC transporter permease subunit [Alphaproteobacteria bacterium]
MLFSRFERLVAFRYLRSRKSEGFVSVIAGFSFTGIMLGVATLIIVMSVMNGFRQELFSRILGLNGHMNVYAASGDLFNYNAIAEELVFTDGIRAVTPTIEAQALVSQHGISSGTLVRGIRPADFQARDILATSILSGSLDNFAQGQVAIGTVLADKMNVSIGDKFKLLIPEMRSTPFGGMPKSRTFTIGAIFDVGMYEYNSGFVFMPLELAQTFFNKKESVTSIEIFLENPEQLDAMRKSIELKLSGMAKVYDWRDTNQSFYNALKTERNVMFLILTMIILIAAFNIISSMIMLVKDKGHDIAILRTMGASSTNMLKIFVLTGASIGIMGTFFGAVLGISFALNIEEIRQFIESFTGTELFADEIYFLSQLPAEIDWSEVWAVIGMALFLSFAATIYPAWRAARLDPVEALRYE